MRDYQISENIRIASAVHEENQRKIYGRHPIPVLSLPVPPTLDQSAVRMVEESVRLERSGLAWRQNEFYAGVGGMNDFTEFGRIG